MLASDKVLKFYTILGTTWYDHQMIWMNSFFAQMICEYHWTFIWSQWVMIIFDIIVLQFLILLILRA